MAGAFLCVFGCSRGLAFATLKNRYYDKKVRESLEIDMAVVRCGQDKVLNRDNGNFVKTNVWQPLFRNMKTLH